ncbi:MAG: VCBS repeat-containing protein [Bacteroidota bacterium]
MSKLSTFSRCTFLLLILCYACQEAPTSQEVSKELPTNALFELLPPEKTNIHFVNQLEEGLNTNVLLYEYFYNGGGVATADFNGDNLIDLYFTSNMGPNKLYLNEGNWQFRDVTDASGAGGRKDPWKTGVNYVDINADGRLDLYVCYSGALPSDKRTNQLFINEGNNEDNIPIFREAAAEYGLNSTAFSNQSYFLDYDRDGDLDMFLLNHNPKSLPVLNERSTAKALQTLDNQRGLRLYQQTNGTFQDITEQAGISGSALSYGLGLGIADVNNDGWPDCYVSNDYTIPDYLYINNQDGTFSNKLAEQMGHTSQFSMGNDIADINNDGWMDIFTLDMLPEDNRRQKLLTAPDNYAKFDLNLRSGFYYQYMRNMLQLNNGNGTFSEIGQLAGIDKTDWSWAALFADYDNDGWKDLYVTNGYHRDYTNMDFIKYMDNFVAQKGRLKREDVMELINQIPSSDVGNYLYKNNGDLTFNNQTFNWGVAQIANSNGAAYADLDNDGDLDLVVNNISQPAFVYENKGNRKAANFLKVHLKGANKNTLGLGALVELKSNGQTQQVSQNPTRGYLSAVSPILHFGLGKNTSIDTLTVTWPNGKRQLLKEVAANQTLVLEEQNAVLKEKSPDIIQPVFQPQKSPIAHLDPKLFIRDFDRQSLLISELSHQSPVMEKGDLNGDGRTDIFIGGVSSKPASIYLGQPNGQFLPSTAFGKIAKIDAGSHDTDVALFDANSDGYLDIYVTSGGYHFFRPNDAVLQDRLYLNDGQGNFTKSMLPNLPISTKTVATADINGDGHIDIFVGGSIVPGRYPETTNSYLLLNDGQGKFTNQIEQIAPELENFGHVTDVLWVDVNRDEQLDLVVIGEWKPVSVFINQNGKLTNQTADFFDKMPTGWWQTIEVADFNQDGQLDFIVGNQGTNFMYQTNESEPVELVYQDFDQNGSVDPFLNYYKQGKAYPDVTRDELLGQLAPLRSQFTSYDSYADATMNNIFDTKALAKAKKVTANHLATSLFLSNGDGKYDLVPLPIETQFSSIRAIQILDYNGDEQLDLLLCGNNSHLKLRLGKSDANYGVLLEGDGKGNFTYVNQRRSGLKLRGDVTEILQLDDLLLFGVHQRPVAAYEIQ